GAPRDDDEVRLLESGGHLVQVVETGRNAGHVDLPLAVLLDVRVALEHERAHRQEARAETLVRDREDLLLRAVEEMRRLLASVERLANDLGPHFDQPAEDRLLVDDSA